VAAELVEVRVQKLGVDSTNNTPVVVLREHEGERILPIWIGGHEAAAIAMHIGEVDIGRPLTHDLLVSVLEGLGGRLDRVVITRVESNTYFAELVVHREGEVVKIDARPSDSIAIALRTGARIFAERELLERIQLEISDEEVAPPGAAPPKPKGSPLDPTASEGMTAQELEAYLRKLDPEDFGRFTP
jgi:hypothetical protein